MGTYDVSVLDFGGGVFEVLSTNGDTHLGGDDFDQVIIDWLVSEFKQKEGVDLSTDPMAMQRLKESAEKAKIELSTATSTEINLPYITATQDGAKHMVETLTRAKFEQLSHELIERHRGPIMNALDAAKLSVSDIDEILLVGGSTRIPAIQNLVKEIFGKEPSHGVNPDEAVAIGAAIQGAVLNKEVDNVLLLDICPLNLSIATAGDVATCMIEAGTTIPCTKTDTFTTYADNQTAITVMVVQGNRPMASQNKTIGVFNLEGILPAPKNVPKIEVSFDMDANSILTVKAKDKATGKEQQIRIEGNSGLSKEEIERMKAEAEANAEADRKLRDVADAVNKAESMVYQQRKLLEEQKDNVKSDEKDKLEGLLTRMEDAAKAKDVGTINSLEAEINTVWQGISTRIYGNSAGSASNPFGFNPQGGNVNFEDLFGGIFNGAGGQQQHTPPPSGNGGVSDADFEEVK